MKYRAQILTIRRQHEKGMIKLPNEPLKWGIK